MDRGAAVPSPPTVMWDFDGTLAQRPGLWSQTLIDVLDRADPGHRIGRDDLRPALEEGFPWHRPDQEHPELSDPEAWWRSVHILFVGAYRSVGYDPDVAERLARAVRATFLDASAWRLFPDTLPALQWFRDRHWTQVIVSNHVPELPRLVADLGLAQHIDHVVTSASVGAEKPNPRIFEHALDLAGRPERVWMVGDNPVADIAGAAHAGIAGILVRRDAEVERRADDLHGVMAIVAAEG